jgi:hypothetical protein
MPKSSAATNIDPVAYLDTKQEILDKIGDLSGFEIANNEVLVAIYMRPSTYGGIIETTDRSRIEDRYQGKASLVLKIGSACRFVRQEPIRNPVTGEIEGEGVAYGIPIAVGDWVVVRTSDTWAFDYSPGRNSTNPKDCIPCRLVFDDQIRAKISHPGLVW